MGSSCLGGLSVPVTGHPSDVNARSYVVAMNVGEVFGALFAFDFIRRRRERQRVRDETSAIAMMAFASIEDVVVDGYRAALEAYSTRIDDVEAEMQAGHLAIAQGILDGASEVIVSWARDAKPLLEAARTDLAVVRGRSAELSQPSQARRLLVDLDGGAARYIEAVEAIVREGWEQGRSEIDLAHATWRTIQARYGLAKYR